MEAPDRPGLNFERLPGWDDTYSIRVTRSYRILLKREIDEAGEFFLAVDIGTHQIYRR
jgi:plasmid maintenance system killer protein